MNKQNKKIRKKVDILSLDIVQLIVYMHTEYILQNRGPEIDLSTISIHLQKTYIKCNDTSVSKKR
jgi:hypothetical protein